MVDSETFSFSFCFITFMQTVMFIIIIVFFTPPRDRDSHVLHVVVPVNTSNMTNFWNGRNTRPFAIPGKENPHFNPEHPHLPADGEYVLPVYPDDGLIKKMYEAPVAVTAPLIISPSVRLMVKSNMKFRHNFRHQESELNRIVEKANKMEKPLFPIKKGSRAIIISVPKSLSPTTFTTIELLINRYNISYTIGLFLFIYLVCFSIMIVCFVNRAVD